MAHRQTRTTGQDGQIAEAEPVASPRHGRRARQIAGRWRHHRGAAAHAALHASERIPHRWCGPIEAVLGTRCRVRSHRFRTAGAAPLKMRSGRSVPCGCNRSSPCVRPHCTAWQRKAAKARKATPHRTSRRTIGGQEVAALPIGGKKSQACQRANAAGGRQAHPRATAGVSIASAWARCGSRPARRGWCTG